jgi:hypothetical protein
MFMLPIPGQGGDFGGDVTAALGLRWGHIERLGQACRWSMTCGMRAASLAKDSTVSSGGLGIVIYKSHTCSKGRAKDGALSIVLGHEDHD